MNTFDSNTLKNYSIKHLIKEGFINLKLIKLTESTARLEIDIALVPKIIFTSKQLNDLVNDNDLVHNYATFEE